MKQMASFYMGMLSPYELEMPRSHDEASSCVVPRPWGWQVSCSLPRPVCTQLPESGTRHEGPRGGVTDLRFDPSQLKFFRLSLTLVELSRRNLFTVWPLNTSRQKLMASHLDILKTEDFLWLAWTCERNCESVSPPIASPYANSGFVNCVDLVDLRV